MAISFLLNETGGHLLNHTGGKIVVSGLVLEEGKMAFSEFRLKANYRARKPRELFSKFRDKREVA